MRARVVNTTLNTHVRKAASPTHFCPPTMAGLLRIRGARQLVQVCKNGEKVLKGAAQGDVAVLTAGERSGLSVVVDDRGNIAAVG